MIVKKKQNEIKNKIENVKNNSDIINISLDDSTIKINEPKKSENIIFSNLIWRKTHLPLTNKINYDNLYKNNYINEKDKKKEERNINNKINKPIIIESIFKENDRLFDNKKNTVINNNKNKLKNDYIQINSSLNDNRNNNSDNENELDIFFKKNKNNENLSKIECIRASNISLYNNNDLSFLDHKNNKNFLYDDFFSKNRNISYFINPKIEKKESEENNYLNDFLIDDNYENDIILEHKSKKDNFLIIPCMNCEKMINIDEIDEHSNCCFKMKKDIKNEDSIHHNISIIDNKLKNIYIYLSNTQNDKTNIYLSNIDFNGNLDLILLLKQKLIEILNIKIINSFSINEMSKINTIFYKLIKKFYNSTNIFTLLSRIKILLEEKIKYFNEYNGKRNKIENKLKGQEKKNTDNNNLRNNENKEIKNKNNDSYENNSIDDAISESETMELFDLKKMEKILDEKRELKLDNLDHYINEAKNKRLFLMEVLKVKYQKINSNKEDELIPPIMIWEEAKKKKIKINDWTKFIFDELNNPNKYLIKIKTENKEKKTKNKS